MGSPDRPQFTAFYIDRKGKNMRFVAHIRYPDQVSVVFLTEPSEGTADDYVFPPLEESRPRPARTRDATFEEIDILVFDGLFNREEDGHHQQITRDIKRAGMRAAVDYVKNKKASQQGSNEINDVDRIISKIKEPPLED